jgi:ADP-heptose:LPS heptosyltransferase
MGCVPEKWHPLQLCYNLPVKGYKRWKSMHQIDALFEFIKTIGIKDLVKDTSIEIAHDSRNKVKNFFKENKIQTDSNIVVFNISNNKPENTWPIERFEELANILSKQFRVICIMTSAPSDEHNAKSLLQKIADTAFYFKTPKVMDFAALAAEANLLICGEGGAMHIGSAVHTPTISLWGKLRPVKWEPYGDRQFMIKKDLHVSSITASDVINVIKNNNLLKSYEQGIKK